MLLPRILSALVMIPVALAAIWWGGYAFALLVAVAGAVMVWEWAVSYTHLTLPTKRIV